VSGARPAKSTPEAQAAFRQLVPDDERVSVRPMFGSVAAFANGYMCMGLYGGQLFFRLGDPESSQLIAAGAGRLEPMPGRPMRDYLVVPGDWQARPDEARRLALASLEHTVALPPKK